MLKFTSRVLTLVLLIIASTSLQVSADVNILIIGSDHDSSDDSRLNASSSAFSPVQIQAQLQSILNGAGLGTVNVEVEERHTGYTNIITNVLGVRVRDSVECYNLTSWFHHPYPLNVETDTRWPKLRGEGGKDWDYVILIEDPYTIEHTPGLFAQGVASIAEEVTKGGAETVLLMPWPAAGSTSTVAHYTEVVYRVGRSGGHKVAPAALAWVAAGSPETANMHPNNTGAFISAASIYSRIWGKSAKDSSYVFDDAVADVVHNTVNTNMPLAHYSDKYQFQSPYRMFDIKDRYARPTRAPGGKSTEDYFERAGTAAAERCGAGYGGGRYYFGRDTPFYTNGLYTRVDPNNKVFVYPYHSRVRNNDDHIAQIFSQEMVVAHRIKSESDTYRILPRRLMWAQIHKEYPSLDPLADGVHLSKFVDQAVGTYMYTLYSGRCPLDPEPNPMTQEWFAQKIGYETAWRVGTLKARAPGFKVTPPRATIGKNVAELIDVQFINPPKSDVTVTISSNSSDITITPSVLTFTPVNYNIIQQVSVLANSGAVVDDALNISYSTSSDDEVFDDLDDIWSYNINAAPTANNKTAEAYSERLTPVTLTGSDPNGEGLSYRIVTQPANGSVILNGAVAVYVSDTGYVGTDNFTYVSNDGDSDSAIATVSINVSATSFYNFNLLLNPSAELTPVTDYGWVNLIGEWGHTNYIYDGSYAFRCVSSVDVGEAYQDVDVSAYSAQINMGNQRFKISGHMSAGNDATTVIVEFRDDDNQELLTHNEYVKRGTLDFDTTLTAPAGTTTVRYKLKSIRDGGSANEGKYDKLSLTASVPVTYANWSNGSSFGDDNNGDGISNGVAFALGANDASVNALGLLPTPELGDDAAYYVFCYRRSDDAHADPNTIICAEYSLDIDEWIVCEEVEGNEDIIVIETNDFYSVGVDKVEVKIKRSLANGKGLFCRLKVTQ